MVAWHFSISVDFWAWSGFKDEKTACRQSFSAPKLEEIGLSPTLSKKWATHINLASPFCGLCSSWLGVNGVTHSLVSDLSWRQKTREEAYWSTLCPRSVHLVNVPAIVRQDCLKNTGQLKCQKSWSVYAARFCLQKEWKENVQPGQNVTSHLITWDEERSWYTVSGRSSKEGCQSNNTNHQNIL